MLDVFPDNQTSASTRPAQAETPPAEITPVTPASVGTVIIESQTSTGAVLRFNPSNVETFSVDGQSRTVTNGLAQVPVGAGESHQIQANWNLSGQEELERYSIYFRWNFPQNGNTGIDHTQGSLSELTAALNSGQPGLVLRVDAYASRDSGSAQTEVNHALSQRRADVLMAQLGTIPGDVAVQRDEWGNQRPPGLARRH